MADRARLLAGGGLGRLAARVHGFGFGLAATPLLSLLLPPVELVPIVLLLQVASSFIGFSHLLERHDRRSTWWLGLSAVLTTPLGVMLLHRMSLSSAQLCIAAVSVAAVVVLGAGLRYRKPVAPVFMLSFGLSAGVLAGLCAMPGPPILAYYLGTDTPPAVARASMILIFLLTGLLALATSLVVGTVGVAVLWLTLLTVPIMAMGAALGGTLFERAPPHLYRPVGLVALAAIALSAGLRALI